MPLHTCAPPRDAEHTTMSLWVCPTCGSTWEGVPWNGVFDFDRNEAVTRAEWILVEGPTQLAG
jgi:ribosomal protein L37AE/L43A